MSISSVEIIMGRIRSATRESPIAVFRVANGLNAVFANTVLCQQQLTSQNLIGVYDATLDLRKVQRRLYAAEARRVVA